MGTRRAAPVKRSLAFATNVFDLEAKSIEDSGSLGDLSELSVALGKALLAVQAPLADTVSWKPTDGAGKENVGIKEGNDPGGLVTEGDGGNQETQGGGDGKEAAEVGKSAPSDSLSDIDLELQLELELSSTSSSHLGDVANKATSTTGLEQEVCRVGSGGVMESRGVMQFLVGTEMRLLFAHKEIVEARCPNALEALGWEGSTPGQPPARVSLNLPEFTVAGVWAALYNIYTARIKFTADDVWDVLQAAVFFELDALSKRCIEVITASVTDSSAWSMLEAGTMLGLKPLMDTALTLIADQTRTILTCTDFTSPSITAASVLKVVQRRDLAIQEKDLAKVLLCQWAETTKEPKSGVDQVMRYISWPQVYEEDMSILSLGMRKRLLPDDVMAEILKWVGGPPKAEMIPNSLKIRYLHWTFLFRHPRCPPSRYKDVLPPELVCEKGKSHWIESSDTPGSFGVHLEGGDHVIVQDSYGRLNATKCFTVEAWVRVNIPQDTNDPDFTGTVVSKHGPKAGWELRINHNNVQLLVTLRITHGQGPKTIWHEISEVPIGTENLKDMKWHHLVGTFSGRAAVVYVDGDCREMVRVVGNNVGGDRKIHDDVELIHHSGPLSIGCNPFEKDQCFNGDISGVRIYNNKVLSENELANRKVV